MKKLVGAIIMMCFLKDGLAQTGVPDKKPVLGLSYGNDATLEQAFNRYVTTGKAPNVVTSGFVKFAYDSAQQPIIETTPFQETVISLEPGEKFTNVSTGDPNRWSYMAAVSGSGEEEQQNILIKPQEPNIATNLVITTTKRIYNLRLVSMYRAKALKAVSFWYPLDMVKEIKRKSELDDSLIVSKTPSVHLDALNFDYRMTCGLFCRKPSFAPNKIFDDGVHTFIEFPKQISSRDLPVLFIVENNERVLVNFRYKAPYFVVDKLFSKAALVMGVGRSKKTLIITNRHYA